MRKSTEQIEAVETANMATCLRRLYCAAGPTIRRTKRAYFNAMQMAGFMNDHELSTLRVALQLP